MTESAEQKEAWALDCAQRERQQCLLFVALASTLVPLWAIVDLLLVPQSATLFAVYRVQIVALLIPCGVVARRTDRLTTIRRASAVALVVTIVGVAAMLPATGEWYDAYVLGYSLIIWASASIFTWPAARSGILYSMAVFGFAAAHALMPLQQPIERVVGAGFYLGSAVIIAVMSSELRHRLLRRAFDVTSQLEARHAELKVAQAHLVAAEKLSALGRLLAGLSHELNNPMNVIVNTVGPLRRYAQSYDRLLVAHLDRRPPEELTAMWQDEEMDFVREDILDALDTMQEASDRMRDIHTNLRTFVQGDANQTQPANLNIGIRATVSMLARTLPPGVAINFEDGDLPPIECYLAELNQVIFNLLRNGLDAVGERGTVTIRTRTTEDGLEVSVEDDGSGVEPEARLRLFEPFFTTKGTSGTGLGLSICHQIVSRHGGTLELDEGFSSGARFVMTLPTTSQIGE